MREWGAQKPTPYAVDRCSKWQGQLRREEGEEQRQQSQWLGADVVEQLCEQVVGALSLQQTAGHDHKACPVLPNARQEGGPVRQEGGQEAQSEAVVGAADAAGHNLHDEALPNAGQNGELARQEGGPEVQVAPEPAGERVRRKKAPKPVDMAEHCRFGHLTFVPYCPGCVQGAAKKRAHWRLDPTSRPGGTLALDVSGPHVEGRGFGQANVGTGYRYFLM